MDVARSEQILTWLDQFVTQYVDFVKLQRIWAWRGPHTLRKGVEGEGYLPDFPSFRQPAALIVPDLTRF